MTTAQSSGTGCSAGPLGQVLDDGAAAAQGAVGVVGQDLDPVGLAGDQPGVAGQRYGQPHDLGPGVEIRPLASGVGGDLLAVDLDDHPADAAAPVGQGDAEGAFGVAGFGRG